MFGLFGLFQAVVCSQVVRKDSLATSLYCPTHNEDIFADVNIPYMCSVTREKKGLIFEWYIDCMSQDRSMYVCQVK